MDAPHLGALFWSQWLAGDLPWVKRARGAWHLRRCAHCRAEAHQLRRARAAYARSDAFAGGLAAVQRRQAFTAAPVPSRRPWPAHPWWRPRPMLAWAGGLAAAVLGMWQMPGDTNLLRPKGDATQFVLYVQRGTTAAPLGETCRAGDALRAGYQSYMPYLLVVELDGTDALQVVFPAGGAASAPIAPSRQLTPGSWVLDASSHQERFVALFSREPLTLQAARACVYAASACGADVLRREVACRKN